MWSRRHPSAWWDGRRRRDGLGLVQRPDRGIVCRQRWGSSRGAGAAPGHPATTARPATPTGRRLHIFARAVHGFQHRSASELPKGIGASPNAFRIFGPRTPQEIPPDVPIRSGGGPMWSRRPVGMVGWAEAAGWPGPAHTTLPSSLARPSPEPTTRRRYISHRPLSRAEDPKGIAANPEKSPPGEIARQGVGGKTASIQHSTLNIQHPTERLAVHETLLDVGCWMLSVGCFPDGAGQRVPALFRDAARNARRTVSLSIANWDGFHLPVNWLQSFERRARFEMCRCG